jgi:uncharacterized protein YoxC
MRLFSTIIIILFFVFLFPFASFSQQPPQGEPQVVRKTILDFKEELKLNEKQVKEIEKFLQEYFKKEKEFVDKIKEKEAKLNQMLNSGSDIKEVKKLAKEIYCLRGELWGEELETAKKIDGVLNDEQKKKWREIRLGKK